MGPPRELHIRPTATGAWLVQLDDADEPFSWHTREADAERSALVVAATYGVEPVIIIHNHCTPRHEDPFVEPLHA